MTWAVVAVAATAAGLSAIVQHVLVPFDAGAHMGLFTNGGDLSIYRYGGLRVWRGEPLYETRVPPGGWFTYPPFAAITFVPLALLSFGAAKATWLLVSFGALVATIWRCAGTLGWHPDRRLALLSLALGVVALDHQAVRGTLWQGQVNIVLMALVVWDLTRPDGSWLRGWSVGVAAGIKLTAVVFIPYLLFTRQWRAAASATGAAALTVALSWVVLPADSTAYWGHAVAETDRIGPLAHVGNYSFGGILATLAAPGPMPFAWWLLLAALVGALGFAAARRADHDGHRLLAITIVGLLSCVVPPLAWGHHWVWTVPLLAVLLDRIARTKRWARQMWATTTLMVFGLVFMWFTAWVYRVPGAVAGMTKLDRLLVVGCHPALFLVVAGATLAGTGGWRAGRKQA